MNISKNKKMCFFFMSQGSFNPKITLLGHKVYSVARRQTHRRTDRQTHTKVTTVGTLSGFQEFLLQPIIKDRPNDQNTHFQQQKTNKQRMPHVSKLLLRALGPVTPIRGSIFPTECTNGLLLFSTFQIRLK